MSTDEGTWQRENHGRGGERDEREEAATGKNVAEMRRIKASKSGELKIMGKQAECHDPNPGVHDWH